MSKIENGLKLLLPKNFDLQGNQFELIILFTSHSSWTMYICGVLWVKSDSTFCDR